MNDNLKKWLPWIAVAAVAVIVIVIIAISGGGDDDPSGDTTTSLAGDTTTTTVGDTTTTSSADTTTTEAPNAFVPIPLQVGALMPQTGALSAIVEALEQPIRMAEDEINGISSGLVTISYADTGTDPAIASTNVDQFLTGNFQAILGPAATGVTLGVFDKINESQLPMCSGSNTGAALSAAEYDPYYLRTAPSDNIQAPALGDLILADGETNVAVVWRSDEYGRGFGEALAAYLTDSGASVPLAEGYDQNAASFTDLAAAIKASGATSLAMITFDEGAQILQDLQGAAFDGAIYVADGFKDNVTVESVGGNAALLEGLRGTAPSSAPANGDPTFPARLEAFAPGTPTIFSAHFYDCTIVTVLAAQEAQSADPTVFVNNMITVTRDGEKCTTFEQCFALISEGVDIDYDGASGPLDFGPNGEPTIGTYDLFEYDAEGAPVTFDQIVGSI